MLETRIAGVQISVIPNDPEKNVEKVLLWMERAASEGRPDLIVFPETVTTGFETGLSKEDLWDLVDTVPGKLTNKVAAKARDLGVHVVLPTYERGERRGDVYNSSVLIGSNGDLIGFYRKTHTYTTERHWTLRGNEAPVFSTPFAKIGMIICYDGDYPELSRVMAMHGAEIIVRPSALLRSFELWDLTCRARSFDNHVYLIGVNATGADAAGNNYFGNSMVANPIGQRQALATAGETILYDTLHPDPLRYMSYGVLKPMIYNHLDERNLKAYEGILSEAPSPFPVSGRTLIRENPVGA